MNRTGNFSGRFFPLKFPVLFIVVEQDRELQWKEPATGVKKPGHRSGTKERIGEKHKEKDVILKKHEHSIWY